MRNTEGENLETGGMTLLPTPCTMRGRDLMTTTILHHHILTLRATFRILQNLSMVADLCPRGECSLCLGTIAMGKGGIMTRLSTMVADFLPQMIERTDLAESTLPPQSISGEHLLHSERGTESRRSREIDLAFHHRWSPSTTVTVACPPMSSLLTITMANRLVPPTTADRLHQVTTTSHLLGTPLHLGTVQEDTLPMRKDFTPLPLINTHLVVLVEATFLVWILPLCLLRMLVKEVSLICQFCTVTCSLSTVE